MSIYIAIIVLLSYVVTFVVSNGFLPKSLSQSVYNIKDGFTWIWTVCMYAIGFCCIMPYMDKLSDNTQWMGFIAIACLVVLGAAPLSKNKNKDLAYKVHMVSAYLCAGFSQLALAFNCPLLITLWLLFLIVFIIYKKEKKNWEVKVFWAEMICFGSTFIFCLI